MTNQARTPRTSPWIVWPVCIFLLVVIYFASFGPFLRLSINGQIPERPAERIYATVYLPIDMLEHRTDFFDCAIGRAYARYIVFWLPGAWELYESNPVDG